MMKHFAAYDDALRAFMVHVRLSLSNAHIRTGVSFSLIEAYCGSLYPYIMPVVAPFLFADLTPQQAIFFNFALISMSLIVYPLGGLVFGWIGDFRGRKKAVTFSLLLLMAATFALGLLPLQHPYAPWFVLGLLMLTSIGSGGELNGGAIFSLEHGRHTIWGTISGLFCAFSVSGILIGSGAAAFCTLYPQWWRLPFMIILPLAFWTIVRSRRLAETPQFLQFPYMPFKWRSMWQNVFLTIMVSSMYGVAYYTVFVFLNSFVPTHTSLVQSQVSSATTLALIIYLLSLFSAGVVADRLGVRQVMLMGSFAITCLSYPALVMVLKGEFLWLVMGQGLLAAAAGIFIGPSYAFMAQLFSTHQRYRGVGLSFTLSMAIIGGSSPVICLGLWNNTQSIGMLALWLGGWGFCTLIAMLKIKGEVRDA